MFAQGGALWTPSGQTATTTTRQVAIKITVPTADLDVNGTLRVRGMAGFDTSLAAKLITANAIRVLGLAQLDALLVNGNTQINGMLTVGSFQINNSSIISSTGNILFGNNNLTTTGNVNAANISALDSIVSSQQLAVDGLQLTVGSQQLAVDSLQLTVGNQQLAVDSLQLTVGSQQLAVDNLQLAVGNQQLAVDGLQLTVGSQQLAVDNLQLEVGNQQIEIDSVIASISADTINDFLPLTGGTLNGNLIVTGNLTLNPTSAINSTAGTSGLTLSYAGIPNVMGFATDIAGGSGQVLAFIPETAAPLINPSTPFGAVILKDENPQGAVYLFTGNTGSNSSGRGIVINGGSEYISIDNSNGDHVRFGGENNHQSYWSAPLGVKFTGGNVVVEASVGIGVTNPTAKLHIGGTPGVDGILFPDGTLQTTSAAGIQSSQWTTSGNKITYPASGTGIVEINGNLKTSAVHGAGGLFLSGIDPAINPNSKAGSITLTPPAGGYYPGGDVILKGGGDGDYYNQEGGAKITLKGYDYWGNSNIMMNIGAGIGGIGNTPNYFSVSDANDAMLLKLMDTGNMGIGTSTPTAKLHIGGTPGVDGIRFPDGSLQTTSASGIQSTQWTTNGNDIVYNTGNVHTSGVISASGYSSNSPFKVYSPAGVERVRIDDVSGNVGIGTAAPGKRLHVTTTHIQGEGPPAGSIRIESALINNAIPATTLATSAWDLEPLLPDDINFLPARFQIGTPGNPLLTLTENDGINIKNKLRIGTLDNPPILSLHDLSIHSSGTFSVMQLANSATGYNEFDGFVISSTSNDVQLNLIENGSISFLNGNGVANSPKMFIDPNGNVGIGTTTPGAKLDINGDIKFSSATITGNIETPGYFKSGNSIYIAGGTSGGNPDNTIYGTDGKITFSGGMPDDIQLGNINVGIGTTSPETTLDVRGNVSIGGSDFVLGKFDNHIQKYKTQNRALVHDGWQQGKDDLVINYDGDFEDGVFVGGPKLVVDYGNVGIGTSDPSQQLHIRSTSPSIRLQDDDVNLGTNEIADFVITNDNGAFRLIDNSISNILLSVLKNGNVGIGGFGSERLHVNNGRIRASSGNGYINIFHDTGNSHIDANGTGALLINYYSKKDVGICGTLTATKIKVYTGWCDYVFDEKFERPTIEEKEIFYKTFKHLPNIPKASEIETNGLDVSDVMKGMMQNIEEDRLDITELYKRLIKLEKENEELRMGLNSLKK